MQWPGSHGNSTIMGNIISLYSSHLFDKFWTSILSFDIEKCLYILLYLGSIYREILTIIIIRCLCFPCYCLGCEAIQKVNGHTHFACSSYTVAQLNCSPGSVLIYPPSVKQLYCPNTDLSNLAVDNQNQWFTHVVNKV